MNIKEAKKLLSLSVLVEINPELEIGKERKVMLKEPFFAEIKKVMTDLKRQKNITLLK